MAIHNRSSLDYTFRALSDPTRRDILDTISRQGECTAGELAALYDSAQPTISKHIKVMETAKLLERCVVGRNHYFKLNDAPLHEADRWLKQQLSFWEGTLENLARYLDDSAGD